MDISGLKRYFLFPSIYLLFFISIFIFSSAAQAASSDIQAQLSDNSGSTGFSVLNNSGNQVTRADSTGNLTTAGIMAAAGNVGAGTTTPRYALDVNGDIGNSVSGMLVLEGSVNTVNNTLDDSSGNAYFAGNVGIGSTVPLGTSLEVNGIIHSASGGFTFPDGTTQTSAASGGNAWSMGSGDVYTTTRTNNVGIGTSSPSALLAVGLNAFTVNTSGAITATTGITNSGAYIQNGGGAVNTFTGNVGIGSTAPGTALDVNGTVRMAGLTMSGGTPSSGYVLTAADSSGEAVWSPSGSVGTNYWSLTAGAGNVGISTTNTVGIGTTSAGAGSGLVVMNGNVGIGTWAPTASLAVGTNAFTVNSAGAITATTGIATSGAYTQSGSGINSFNGNIGIGTTTVNSKLSVLGGASFGSYATTAAPAGGLIISGNVGIASITPGQALDVDGTVRMVGFTMSSGTPSNGYVLTAADSSGDATWSPEGTVSGWVTSGSNLYNTNTGNVGINTTNGANVGIGTTTPAGGLVVMNGNVGIGTWAPQGGLVVMNGNVGIGVTAPSAKFYVSGDAIIGSTSATAGGTSTFASNGTGSLAAGDVNATAATGSITSSGTGSIALGYTDAAGTAASITSNNDGSIAEGFALGTMLSSGSGSIAMGEASPNHTLQATQSGSVAIGQDVQATASNALAFGASVVNNTSNTFMVGFNAAPTLTVTATNVGVGSISPGQALDVQGTVRMAGLTVSGGVPSSGYVLTAADSSGDTMWSPSGSVGTNYWSLTGGAGNVGISTTNTVGIGTTSAGAGAGLVVMNGNVGIGTWVPSSVLSILGNLTILGGNTITTDVNTTNGSDLNVTTASGTSGSGHGGNLTISTGAGSGSNPAGNLSLSPGSGTGGGAVSITSNGGSAISLTTPGSGGISGNINLTTSNGGAIGGSIVLSAGSGGSAANDGTISLTTQGGKISLNGGNVGIGSTIPGQALDVQGTARMVGLTVSGGVPSSGYVLTAADSSGDTMWSPSGSVGTNYWSLTAGAGNVGISTTNAVGIGTTSAGAGAGLVVMNGNVGIGTWAPTASLAVGTNAFTVNSTGAITATTGITTSGAYTQSGAGVNYFTGNVGVGTTTPQGSLVVTNGNVGIGTWTAAGGNLIVNGGGNVGIGSAWPGTVLDVHGVIRSTSGGFTFPDGTTQTTALGNNSWSMSNGNVYTTTGSNNVGIGTTNPQGGLIVTNGNVGIGTWAPTASLAVGTNAFTVNSAGAITATTGITTSGAYTQSGTGINYFTGNVGVGTTAPQTRFSVVGGNVGIGTWTAAGGNLIVNGGGNVGIGSAWPGQVLDVQGTVRATGFIAGTGGITLGGVTNTSWSSAGSNYWLNDAGNVGISTTYAVGIGTTFVGGAGEASFAVMNGNVGIGTWVPNDALDIEINNSTKAAAQFINNSATYGSVIAIGQSSTKSIDTGYYGSGETTFNSLIANTGYLATGTGAVQLSIVTTGAQPITFDTDNFIERMRIQPTTGNVGIGSTVPGQTLDVQGTVRATEFIGSGAGLTNLPGGASAWSTGTGTVYTTTGSNNVGIGTTNPQGGLIVTNGNVGIGTWAPTASLAVGTNAFTVNSAGAITATTGITTSGAYTQSGTGINYFTGNVGVGTTAPQTRFAVVGGNVGIGTWTAAGGNLIVNGGGNVGIGSAWPGQVLDVQGTVRATGFIAGTGGITLNGVTNTSWPSAGANYWSLTAAAGNVGISTTNTVGIGTTSGVGAGLVVMNGNVGIGTWVPAAQLDVNGGIQLETAGSTASSPTTIGFGPESSGNAQRFRIDTDDALQAVYGGRPAIYTYWGMEIHGQQEAALPVPTANGTATDPSLSIFGTATDAAPVLQLLNNAGTIKLFTVNGAGNVGIGTFNPGEQLDIKGTGTSELTIQNNWLSGAGVWINMSTDGPSAIGSGGAGTNPWVAYVPTAGDWFGGSAVGDIAYRNIGGRLLFGTTSSAPGMVIGTNNNVGIGSASPGETLDVTGTVRATNFIGNGSGLTGLPSSSLWATQNTTDQSLAGGNVGIGTTITNAGGALSVMNGNVGIGTWVPGSLLDVAGNLILGQAGSSADSISTSGATDSFAGGNASHGGGAISGSITSSGTGSFAFGYSQGSGGGNHTSIISNSDGSIALGYTTGGNIESEATGSFAAGYASGGTLEATQSGAVAMGYTSGQNIEATGLGSIAMGYSIFSGSAIPVEATGTASVAIGQNVQATANNAFALGTSVVNNTASTFMVGFNTAPTLTVTAANVGIGSISPGQALDVQGTVRATNFVGNGSGLTGLSGGLWNTTNTNDVYEKNGSNFGNVGIGTTITNAGAALTVMNGNVGIGTWAPQASVDSAGTIRVTGSTTPSSGVGLEMQYLTGAGGYGQFLTYDRTNSVYHAFAFDALNEQFYNSGTEAMRITSGNLGIGTNTPSSRLTVLGNIGIGRTAGDTYLTTAAPNGGMIVEGDVGIGSINPGQMLDVQGTVRATNFVGNGSGLTGLSATSNWIYSSSGNIGLSTTAAVGIGTTFVSTGNALTVINGNVGIGTWVTANPVDINVGSSAGTISMSNNGNTGPFILLNNTNSGAEQGSGVRFAKNGTNKFGFGIDYNGNGGQNWWVYDYVALSPRLLLDGNGNLGIGTTTPSGGLAVMSGNVGIGTWVPSAQLSLGASLDSIKVAAYDGGANSLYGMGVNAGQLTFGASIGVSGTPQMVLTTAGNVGIGSTVPGQRLDVQGTVRATNFVGNGSGLTGLSSGLWNTTNTNDVYEQNGSTFGNVGIGTTITNAGAALSVMNGNVGIGTWVPVAAMDIVGNMQFSKAARTITTGNDGTNGYGLTIQPATGIGASGTGGNLNLTAGSGSSTTTQGNGGALTVSGGTAGTVAGTYGTGGSVTISGGSSNNGSITGSVTVQSGTNLGDASTGSVTIASPNANGFSGNIGIQTGTSNGSSGTISLTTGVSSGGLGGSINLTAGSGSTATNAGIMTFTTSGTGHIKFLPGPTANVGIGTAAPRGFLDVTGPSATTAPLIFTASGNLGIGSISPGQALDVQGTVRATNFVGNGAGLTNLPSSSLWATQNTTDESLAGGNVGIGTTITNAGAALTIMNGNVGIGTWIPSSTFNIKGSFAVQTISTSASSYTALSTDQVILANASSNTVTITLPAVASVPGREYIIKKTDSSANSVTIQANGAETIDGQNTVSTTTQYQSYTIVSNGTAWYII